MGDVEGVEGELRRMNSEWENRPKGALCVRVHERLE